MVALLPAALGVAGIVVAVRGWRRLKQVPAVTAETRSAGLEGRWTEVGRYRIFARVSNQKVESPGRLPVVLVHGLVVSSRYMEPLAEVLSRHFTVLAPDLPGFGESSKPRHALTLPELAEALHAWLRACGVGKAMLIGNSFGCQILAELALRHPDVVDRLVLQGPTTDPAARHLPVQVWRDIVNGRREPRPMGPLSRIDYAKAGLPRAFATMRMLVRDRIEDKLPHIQAPTLVVRGTRDPVVPQEWAEQATRLLPRGRLVLIDGGTHTLNYSYPNAFASGILPFLLEGAGAPAADTVVSKMESS
jgi:pimeloyl-ACP methyl ester carboxylesterase